MSFKSGPKTAYTLKFLLGSYIRFCSIIFFREVPEFLKNYFFFSSNFLPKDFFYFKNSFFPFFFSGTFFFSSIKNTLLEEFLKNSLYKLKNGLFLNHLSIKLTKGLVKHNFFVNLECFDNSFPFLTNSILS